MLFHVTATHTEDNCPIYHPEKMPEVMAALEGLDGLAAELGVKAHFTVVCGPDHVFFALLEADNFGAVSRYLFSVPMPQATKIVPVQHLSDTIEMAKAAAAAQQG